MDTAAQTTPSAPVQPSSNAPVPTPAAAPQPKPSTATTASPAAPKAANAPAPAGEAPKAPAASVSAPGTPSERVNPAPQTTPSAQETTRDGTRKSDFFTAVRGYARNITAAAQKLTAKLDAAGHDAEVELNKLNSAVTEMNDHLNASGRTASTPVPGSPVISNPQKATAPGNQGTPTSAAQKPA